jgi:hypothetical protein
MSNTNQPSPCPTCSCNRRHSTLRIPLRRRAVEQPTDEQLLQWARKRDVLKRLSPKEASLPLARISTLTMTRLRQIYAASLEKWKAKEALELASRPPSEPLAAILAKSLAELDRS